MPRYTGHETGQLEEHLRLVSRKKLAEKITGGLSRPGKMPCPGWGIPAKHCRVGSSLDNVEGSPCHKDVCYAKQRNYKRETVQKKLEQRYEGLFLLQDGVPLWTPAMIFLVSYYCDEYFRLFDSGDLQDENHYHNVITLARHVPDVKIWMPTREIQTLQNVHRELARDCIEFPSNLIPRVSANLIDGKPPRGFAHTSTVVTSKDDASCVAQLQKNKCDGEIANCRACWTEPHVTYPLH